MNYNSRTVPGHDYSRPLADVLPDIIGKRSKSIRQIAKAAGRSETTTKNVINRLHAAGKLHIKRWKRTVGPYVAYYSWGPGVDAQRPAPQPRSIVHKRYRQTENGKAVCRACRNRWRASETGSDYMLSYNKARWAREKLSKGGLAAIDPLLAAIMGRRNQPEKEQECT